MLLYSAASADDCTNGADVLVFPLPYAIDGKINAPLWNKPIDIEVNSKCRFVFAGKADNQLAKICSESGVILNDYAEREEFAVMNAIPTVEGAIEIAISKTPYTIHGSRCLVVGYGRIGKLLSSALRSLGADVCVTARKYSDLAWIAANGCKSAHTSSLNEIVSDYNIIFNTVPQMLFDFRVLANTKPDVLLIDLASRPGGMDFEVAKRLNRRAIQALSLPGKCAPDTAGDIIKNTIINILEESEV